MKRLLFYILMVTAIAGSTYFVVCGNAGLDAGLKTLEALFDMVFDFSLFEAELNAVTIELYALLFFVVFNAILIVILAFMLLLNFGAFSRVRRFYTVAVWFFIGALIFTVATGYVLYDINSAAKIDIADWIFDQPWQTYLPIVSSVVLLIFAVAFRESEKKF